MAGKCPPGSRRKRSRRESRGEAFWFRAVARQDRSGLSVRAFCRERGLGESAYYYWKRRLIRRQGVSANPRCVVKAGAGKASGSNAKRADGVPASPGADPGMGSPGTGAPAFAALRVIPSPGGSDDSAIELVLSGERRVRVRRGFDAETLLRLLAVLEGAPC